MQLKDVLTNMFGFIWTQPIHITLRQMRLVHVGLIISSQLLLWRIVDNLETLDPMESAMAYGTIASALIVAIWASINGLHKSNGKDDG
jgi:hypothetical protein